MRAGDLQSDGKTSARKSARNRDRRQSPQIYRTGIAKQQKLPRTEQIRVLLQFSNRRGGNRYGWSYQKVYILKHVLDVVAYLLQFAAALLDLLAADVLALTDPTQRFRQIQLRTPGNELGVIRVCLRGLQRAVRGDIKLDLRQIAAEGFYYAERLLHGERNFRIKIFVEKLPGNADPRRLGFFP